MLGIAALTTVFLSPSGSGLQSRLEDSGVASADAKGFADAVTDTAGAAIPSIGRVPGLEDVADLARQAMTDAVAFGAFLAAGSVLVGVVATSLIPSRPARVDRSGPMTARRRGGR